MTHHLLIAPEQVGDARVTPARAQHYIHFLLTHWVNTNERLLIEGIHDKKCCAIL